MRKNAKSYEFGKWLKPLVEAFPEIKKKTIAVKAGISAVSFSRILSGEHGVANSTAENLMRALNELAGRQIVDINEGLKILAGVGARQTSSRYQAENWLAGIDLSDFNQTDFAWLAQLIEMRSLWKNNKLGAAKATEDIRGEDKDFFLPPEETSAGEEPAPIKLEDLLDLKSKRDNVHQFSGKKKSSS